MRAVYQEEKRKRIARNHRSFELNSLRRQQTRLKKEALKISINIDSIDQLIVAAYRRQNVFVPQNLRLNCTKLIEGFSLQQHSINDAKSCIITLKKAIQTLQNGVEKRHVMFMNIIKKRQSGTPGLPSQKANPQDQPHRTTQFKLRHKKSSFSAKGTFNPVMITLPRKKEYADSASRLNPDAPVFTPRGTHSSRRLCSP